MGYWARTNRGATARNPTAAPLLNCHRRRRRHDDSRRPAAGYGGATATRPKEDNGRAQDIRVLTLDAWMLAAVTEEAGVDGELARRSSGRSWRRRRGSPQRRCPGSIPCTERRRKTRRRRWRAWICSGWSLATAMRRRARLGLGHGSGGKGRGRAVEWCRAEGEGGLLSSSTRQESRGVWAASWERGGGPGVALSTMARAAGSGR